MSPTLGGGTWETLQDSLREAMKALAPVAHTLTLEKVPDQVNPNFLLIPSKSVMRSPSEDKTAASEFDGDDCFQSLESLEAALILLLFWAQAGREISLSSALLQCSSLALLNSSEKAIESNNETCPEVT